MTLTATADAETLPQPAGAPLFAEMPQATERPVFAATTPVRPRALKMAGRATAVLVGLWLFALVLGTFGFGPVAGIGLPRIGGGGEVHRNAARTSPVEQPAERVSRSGVTLATRYTGMSAAPTTRHGSGPTGASHRSAARQPPGSQQGTSGGNRGPHTGAGSQTGNGSSGAPAQAPASAAPTPSATTSPATPASTQPTSNSHSTHSQATPPGSSSSAPGSRSNAGTAPGREQSASTPSPGSGRTEHAPPKG